MLLKKLFTILCIIVCSYQLYFTTVHYLEFNVITLLDIDFPEWFTVPDMTLCVQFLDAVNWTAWAIHHPDLLPDNCMIIDDENENRSKHIRECFAEMGADDFEGFVEQHFTVAKFYKIVNKAEAIFDNILFYNKTGNFNGLQRNHDIFCTTRTYLKDPHVCYHVACRNATNSVYIRFHRNRLLHSPNPGAMYQFDLYNEFFESWDHVFVYMHSPLDLPRGPLESYLVIKPKEKPSLFLLSFVKIIDNLLEPPYATKCKDYHHDVEGTRSLMHKYEQCLNNQTIQLDPSFVMYQTIIENPQEIEANFSNRLRYKYKYKDKLNEIRKECGKLVKQPECNSYIYIPYIIGHERFVFLHENHSVFLIMAPTNPDIKLVKSPVFTLETYVVSIGSILGIWFGFSMVHHLGSLGSHLLKLKNISKFSWNNICHRDEKLLKKSVNLNCEQINQKQNTAERPAIVYYRTHGLLSRARAAIAESRRISELSRL